jgi:D-lactate dehydrogenase
MKTLIYSIHAFDRPFLESATKGKHNVHFTESALSEETVGLAKGCEAISLFTGDHASAEVLEQLHAIGVKYIALRSVGYDHVDLEKAKQLGLKVANVPAYSPNAIAEHAVALILVINRKLAKSRELMEQNDFRLDELVGFDLFGKTVGLIGTGKIGAAFARIMNGFGCRLIAFDPVENTELTEQTGIRYASLETVCAESDILAIHCPLNAETKQLFNKSLFAQVKKGALFVNTARGGIVNTVDLLEALDNGTIAAAGLDVYEFEKPIYFKDLRNTPPADALFERLRNHPRVVLTGHQAFLTNEALTGIAETTVANLDQWQEAGRSENEVI